MIAGVRLVVAVLALASTGAAAEGICVECSEPAATYRCTPVDAVGGHQVPAKAAQVLCMTELAKAGGHRYCRVTQGTLGGLCNGPERVVAISRQDGAALVTAPEVPPGQPAGESKAPATLVDMAKDAAQSSGQGVQKAGDAIKKGASSVGDTIKDAVDCVVSLFKRC